MRGSTKQFLALPAVMAIYLAVVATGGSDVDAEKFPFFNWHLYSSVDSEQRTYIGLRLTEVNGRPVPEPFYFEDRPGLLPRANSAEAVVLLQRWGHQVQDGDLEGAAESQALFEARFLEPLESARYELVARTFNLLERIECDCYISEEVVGAYELG